jgi:hypothetical protein
MYQRMQNDNFRQTGRNELIDSGAWQRSGVLRHFRGCSMVVYKALCCRSMEAGSWTLLFYQGIFALVKGEGY